MPRLRPRIRYFACALFRKSSGERCSLAYAGMAPLASGSKLLPSFFVGAQRDTSLCRPSFSFKFLNVTRTFYPMHLVGLVLFLLVQLLPHHAKLDYWSF